MKSSFIAYIKLQFKPLICFESMPTSGFKNLRVVVLSYILLLLLTPNLSSAQQSTILDKKISIQVSNTNLADVLKTIGKKANCIFSYSNTAIKDERKVSVNYNNESVRNILYKLFGKDIDLQLNGNQIFIRQGDAKGTIKGTVKTSDGKPAAFVSVGIKNLKTTQTDENGKYTLHHVDAGNYTLSASFVGLKTQSQSVMVASGKTENADFILAESGTELSEVLIKGDRSYLKTKPSSSLRIKTSLLETPQNIVSLNSALIKDQQAFTITEISRNVSGVSSLYAYSNNKTDFSIRGLASSENKLRNGMPLRGTELIQEDMSYVESVEFVKGPAGFMLSQGEPGGMYNVTTKKPLREAHQSVEFTFGSYNTYRSAIDIGGPLGRKLFYRLNAMGQKAGTFVDYGVNNRMSIAPVLRYEFDKKTSLTAEYNYDQIANRGTDPSSSTQNRVYFPRNFSLEDPSNKPSQFKSHYGLLNLQHKLSEQINITVQTGFNTGSKKDKNLTSYEQANAQGILQRKYLEYNSDDEAYTAQAFLDIKTKTGNIGHTLLAGVDLGSTLNQRLYRTLENVLPIDINNPVYGLGALAFDTLFTSPANQSKISEYKDAGGYGSPAQYNWKAITLLDQLKFTHWLQLSIGGRYTYHSYGEKGAFENNEKFTPRAGLIVQPFANTSLYVMYDQSFMPQSGSDFSGKRFIPVNGNNIEIGLKREWLNQQLLTQISVFEITKNNALTTDPVNRNFSIQTGQIKSRGFELDILGSINKNFSMVANYGYINAKTTKDTDPLKIGVRTYAPVNMYNLWLKYKLLNGHLKGLSLGLGGNGESKRYTATYKKNPTDPQMQLPDFFQLNSSVAFNKDNFGLALNVNNINNVNIYYGLFSGSNGANGEFGVNNSPGRNFRLTASYKFN